MSADEGKGMEDMTKKGCDHDDDLHPPIYWNPYNKVFQCHKCGIVFEERRKTIKEVLEWPEIKEMREGIRHKVHCDANPCVCGATNIKKQFDQRTKKELEG